MTELRNILIVEDNIRDRMTLSETFENMGFSVTCVHDGNDAVKRVKADMFQLILFSLEAPGPDYLFVVESIKNESETAEIIVLSNEPSVEKAVESMKSGALDFLVKPVDITRLTHLINRSFSDGMDTTGRAGAKSRETRAIITKDKSMLRLLDLAKQVADSRASVLIQGESGTGKELFARFFHENSKRKNGPFVAVNCGALPENLLESELFGHEKGAFTGAVSKKPGKFELADNGTILLDEITEMQYHLQAKLLRVIQEREIDRVGGFRSIKVDVRIISTTNRDIKELVRKDEFREDLFYRLNVVPFKLPPLRERGHDIEHLAEYFIAKYNEIDGRNVSGLSKDAVDKLMRLHFKGNVRELENIIERAILLSDGEEIKDKDLLLEEEVLAERIQTPGEDADAVPAEFTAAPLKEVEKKLIFHTLDHTNGNRTHAAKILGISVRTLRNKLNEYKENMENV